MSADEVKGILFPLLSGLEEVHAAGYLHRDIKPGNIVIRDDGSPVLIDFGAARQAVGGEEPVGDVDRDAGPHLPALGLSGREVDDERVWARRSAPSAPAKPCISRLFRRV